MLAKIKPNNSFLILCDVQEAFRSRVHKMPALVNSASFLILTSAQLEIPFVLSQHYTSAFGETLSELKTAANEAYKENFFQIEKRQFSLVTPDLSKHLSEHPERKNIILMGVESHICIKQSTMDFLRKNYGVFLVADAISSQRVYDREVALQQLQTHGAVLTTAEAIAYELMETSLHPQFKAVLGFVKERSKGEFF